MITKPTATKTNCLAARTKEKDFKCGRKAANEGLHSFYVPMNNQGYEPYERYHQTRWKPKKHCKGINFHFVISGSLKQKKRKEK
jgi:hypothetical protein